MRSCKIAVSLGSIQGGVTQKPGVMLYMEELKIIKNYK
jgi:hypothetical protein